jgi:hypothetical protein
MYSCALWSDEEGGVLGDTTSDRKPGDLDTAQLRKIHYVLRKARIQPGDRLLEFGSGWGGLAIEVRFSRVFPESLTENRWLGRRVCRLPALTAVR